MNLFELPLVHNKQVLRTRFLAEPETVRAVLETHFDAIQDELCRAPDFLNEFQILTHTAQDGSAEELVGVLTNELSIPVGPEASVDDIESADQDELKIWNVVLECAQAIDASLAARDATPEFTSLEFVWDNGGSEDNAFSQGFWFNAKEPKLLHALQDALEDVQLNHAPFYDIQWINDHSMDGAWGLAELQEFLAASGASLPVLSQVVDQFRSVERAQALDESLTPSAPARRGPRF